jgi:Ferritin-like domain
VVTKAPVGAPGVDAAISRRTLLRGAGTGLLLGATAVIAGCGGSSRRALAHRLSEAARRTDVDVLNHLLDIEHRAVAAYTAAIPLLDHRAQHAAQLFLQHELAHVDELSALISRQRGIPDKQQPAYELGQPESRRDVLELLRDIELAQISGYLAALPEVAPGTARAAVGAILSSDAQHLAVLRGELALPQLTGAFVTGSE